MIPLADSAQMAVLQMTQESILEVRKRDATCAQAKAQLVSYRLVVELLVMIVSYRRVLRVLARASLHEKVGDST